MDQHVQRTPPADTLPEAIPVRAGIPPRPRRVGFVFGALGLWVTPGRAGAHVGAVGWHTAVIVAILGSFASVCLLLSVPSAAEYDADRYFHDGPLTFGERLRMGPAQAVLKAIAKYADRDAAMIVGLAAPGAIAGFVLLAALISVPFADAGERLSRLFARCVKIACWLTTLGIPVGLIILAGQQYADRHELSGRELFGRDWEQYRRLVPRAAFTLAAYWAIFVWLRALSRYAGPAEGPGWQPVAPRCVDCGYILTGLSANGICPECGLGVAASLPAGRRPSLWQRVRFFPVRLILFPPTVLAIGLRRGYFGRLPVRSGKAAATSFWLCNWVLLSLVAAPLLLLIYQDHTAARAWSGILMKWLGFQSRWGGSLKAADYVLAFFAVSIRVLAVQALISTLYYWVTVRRRPTNAPIALYLPAFLWPPAACLIGLATGLSRYFQGQSYGFAITAAAIVLAFASVAWSLRRIANAHRATRYATA